jgi:hypothetical protein
VNRFQLKSELVFDARRELTMMPSSFSCTKEGTMRQVHKRLSDDQIAFVLQQYQRGVLSRASAQEVLGVGKTRFFALLHTYRRQPDTFSVAYHRSSPSRLSAAVEEAMERELLRERALVEDPELPISDYNYSAVRDRLGKQGMAVSLTTLIARAKALGCYRRHPKRKVHDRQVLTSAIGALIQHDASTHRWSPYADAKWTLIASIDDYSRKLLYAEFVPQETTWAHIQAVRCLVEGYGVPLAYYVDSLRVFRFVQHRDSVWRREVLGTDQADPQWKQVMRLMGIDVTYALSPQAKGKIERPFRWLQDRIVRTCALEHIATIEQGGRCCGRRGSATTHISATPPPARSPISASPTPSPPALPCFDPLSCPSPTRCPRTSSVCARPGSRMATVASRWPIKPSPCPRCCRGSRSKCISSRTSPSKLCTSACGGRANSSALRFCPCRCSEFTFEA